MSEGIQHPKSPEAIGYTGDGDARCCVCACEDVGTVTIAEAIQFKVCLQCHGNGDWREWFLDWFMKQYDDPNAGKETP